MFQTAKHAPPASSTARRPYTSDSGASTSDDSPVPARITEFTSIHCHGASIRRSRVTCASDGASPVSTSVCTKHTADRISVAVHFRRRDQFRGRHDSSGFGPDPDSDLDDPSVCTHGLVS